MLWGEWVVVVVLTFPCVSHRYKKCCGGGNPGVTKAHKKFKTGRHLESRQKSILSRLWSPLQSLDFGLDFGVLSRV